MTEQTKWKLYESRWKIRDFYFDKVLRQHILEKYFGREPKMYLYGGKCLQSIERLIRLSMKLLWQNSHLWPADLEIMKFGS